MTNLIASNRSMILALALSPALSFAQNPEGGKLFATQCAGCHGADAHGTDRGPGLAANRRVRSRSVQQLRDFIRKGASGSGMPAFDLPRSEERRVGKEGSGRGWVERGEGKEVR